MNFGKAMVDAFTQNGSGTLGVIESMLQLGGYLTDPNNIRICTFIKSEATPRVLKHGTLMAEQFWSQGAIAFGVNPTSADGNPEHAHARQAAKVTAIAGIVASDGSCQSASKVPDMVDSNYLRTDVKKRMAAGPTCLDFQVQFQVDPALQSIEDTSVVWKASDSPFTSIGSVTIPQVDLDKDPQAQTEEQFCNNLRFSVWHTLPDHRPLGSTMRARKVVYASSASHRGGAADEPTGNEFPTK
jgi:hypothetical protein